MVFLHELNHGIIRELDDDKQNNFFNDSKRNKANGEIKYKGIAKNYSFFLPLNESGDYFDYLLYGGYYLDTINKEFCLLFSQIKNMERNEDFTTKLKEIIKKIQPDSNSSSIFKFKKDYGTNIVQCCLSFIRSSQLRQNLDDESNSDKSDRDNSDMDISDEQDSDDQKSENNF